MKLSPRKVLSFSLTCFMAVILLSVHVATAGVNGSVKVTIPAGPFDICFPFDNSTVDGCAGADKQKR